MLIWVIEEHDHVILILVATVFMATGSVGMSLTVSGVRGCSGNKIKRGMLT